MTDDYLWSGAGQPDPEIDRLERLLAPYRCPPEAGRPEPRRPRRAFAAVCAAAASVAVAAWLVRAPVPPRQISNWQLEIEGSAARPLREGEIIRTQDVAVRIASDDVGELQLEPNSRLRVVRSRADQERFALNRGTIHALIWAPPQKFVVDTPSATTIDLGCSYELTVSDDGSGILIVSSGWVAFQAGTVESFIPAGAMCRTEPRRGPGLPYYEDAPEAFRAAVGRWEATGGREGVDDLVAAARKDDALTLWHLLLRTVPPDRGKVARRFAELAPGISAAPLERGERPAIEAAWNALGLGDADWWRTWKQKW